MANAAAPAATEFPLSENPPLTAQAGTAEMESEKEGDQATAHHEEGNKSPADKEDKEEREAGRDDDRSRSPRLRMQEPFDPNEATDLLSSTTGLAVGITSMVAALKGSTDKLETLIKSTHTLQQDLCRSLEAVGAAVNNMARASESLAAGVNHNTSRVGAVVGEYNKLKKHLEWAMDVSMGEVLKKNAKNRTERDQALQDLMTQLFESMDKLQENAENCCKDRKGTSRSRGNHGLWSTSTSNGTSGYSISDAIDTGTWLGCGAWYPASTGGTTHGTTKAHSTTAATPSCGEVCGLQSG